MIRSTFYRPYDKVNDLGFRTYGFRIYVYHNRRELPSAGIS